MSFIDRGEGRYQVTGARRSALTGRYITTESRDDREQTVIELADEVLDLWDGHISTHYEGCWKRHVACFATLVKDVLEGEEQ